MQRHAAWEAWRRLGSPEYIVAPMVDGSELAFRDLCRRHGAKLAYTPMLNARIFSKDAKYRAEHFTTHATDRPLVAQFCANDAETLVTAATHVQNDVDAIDLNLGCPQGIARKGHYGAFLMEEWGLIEEIISTAVQRLTVPVWCKIRIYEDVEKTVRYGQMLEKAGVSVIAVHGRTREQKGKNAPVADMGMIRRVRESVGVPVIANGNVKCLSDVHEALQETGCEGVMSAFGLLDNPGLFVGGGSRMALAKEYLEVAERYRTPMRMVRLHIFKMFRGRLDHNMDLNEEVAKCRSVEDFRRVSKVLEERCDGGGVSFEERLSRGEVTRVMTEKRAERLRKKEEKKTEMEMGLK